MELQVNAPSGAMRVTVPAGLKEGDVFLVRQPAGQHSIPTARHVASASSSRAYAQNYSGAYPGASSQPNVVVVQQQPPMVYPRPYYGGYPGYGYGYGYDPLLMGGMGFMGGMLLADAMWW